MSDSPTTQAMEQLREKILSIIQKRNMFIVGQAKHVFDGIVSPQRADENNIAMNREARNEIISALADTLKIVGEDIGLTEEQRQRLELVVEEMKNVR